MVGLSVELFVDIRGGYFSAIRGGYLAAIFRLFNWFDLLQFFVGHDCCNAVLVWLRESYHPQVTCHVCDVSSEADVLAFRDAVMAAHGTDSRGRDCHYVTILIQARLVAAVIVCIFERVWIRIVT